MESEALQASKHVMGWMEGPEMERPVKMT